MTQILPTPVEAGPAPDRRGRPEFHGSAVAAFREAVAAHPDRAAVVGVDATLSYAELDDRSDRLATLLTARGAGPECAVGVLLPRTADLIVAILGILKAGAVYVPFDPEQPAQRLGRIVRDAAPVTTITHAGLVGSLPEGSGPDPVLLDRTDWAEVPRSEPVTLHPDNLAYVIFTSGSTGRPKGVEVSHRALVSFLNGMEQGGSSGRPAPGWPGTPPSRSTPRCRSGCGCSAATRSACSPTTCGATPRSSPSSSSSAGSPRRT